MGVEPARRLDAEVVALDSMTLYRAWTSAPQSRPSRSAAGAAPPDVFDPWESANVAAYRELATAAAEAIEGRTPRPVCRRALPQGPAAGAVRRYGPPADPERARSSSRRPKPWATSPAHARSSGSTPFWRGRLHLERPPADHPALEVGAALTGRPLEPPGRRNTTASPEPVAVFSLDRPREELYERINVRVLAMFEAGLDR
ncbi:MAG: hypothetical protein U0835_20535 [Isosphaeraceae bacterium]